MPIEGSRTVNLSYLPAYRSTQAQVQGQEHLASTSYKAGTEASHDTELSDMVSGDFYISTASLTAQ